MVFASLIVCVSFSKSLTLSVPQILRLISLCSCQWGTNKAVAIGKDEGGPGGQSPLYQGYYRDLQHVDSLGTGALGKDCPSPEDNPGAEVDSWRQGWVMPALKVSDVSVVNPAGIDTGQLSCGSLCFSAKAGI